MDYFHWEAFKKPSLLDHGTMLYSSYQGRISWEQTYKVIANITVTCKNLTFEAWSNEHKATNQHRRTGSSNLLADFLLI